MSDNEKRQGAEKALSDYQKLVKEKNEIETENSRLQIALDPKNGGNHYVDSKGNLTAFDKGRQSVEENARPGLLEENRKRLAANMARLPQIVSDMQGAQNRYADLSGNQGARPTGGGNAPAAPAPAAAPAAEKPKYNVGDTVTSKGKKYKVLGYNPDGTIKAQAL